MTEKPFGNGARHEALQTGLEIPFDSLRFPGPTRFADRRQQQTVSGLEAHNRQLARRDIGPVLGRVNLGQRHGNQHEEDENAAHRGRIHWPILWQ